MEKTKEASERRLTREHISPTKRAQLRGAMKEILRGYAGV